MESINQSGRLAVSVREAARLIGVSRALFYPFVMSGDCPSKKIGARRVIMVDELQAWVRKGADAGKETN